MGFSSRFLSIRKPIDYRIKLVLGGLAVVVLLLFYNDLSIKQHIKNPRDTTLPSFTQLIDGVQAVLTPDRMGKIWLWEDAKATFCRHFVGLTIGVIASIIIGMAMGCFEVIEAFFYPILSVFSKIPPTAMMVIYFVLFGTKFQMFVGIVALGTIPILALTICQFVKDININLIDKGYTLGCSKLEVIYDIIFKTILPKIIESVRLQVGPALVLLIAAEMLTASVGFGYRLRKEGHNLQLNIVFIYLAVLAISYHLIDYALKNALPALQRMKLFLRNVS